MQVKKFEARSMKEALEMVKTQLGPDAIILSARDNNRSFGLVGEGSVEITAAVSEETLRKKQFTESRLREEDKEKLNRSSARMQKQVIDRMVNKYIAEKEEKTPRQLTRTRYIDIDDENQLIPKNSQYGQQSLGGGHAGHTGDAAAERIKSAAQRAWSTMQTTGGWQELMQAPQPAAKPAPQPARQQVTNSQEVAEIQTLKNEIAGLKQVLSQFQHMPQTFTTGQHPGASYGLSYDMVHMFEKLTQAGIAEDIAAEMLTQAQEQMPGPKIKNKALVEAWTAKYILNSTTISTNKNNSKIHVFVGPAGTGKTSSLIKLASHSVVKEGKKVAILTTDTLKVGATDQMRIYAQILNVPYAVVRQKSDWEKIMAQLSGYDLILVDFPGLGLKTMEEISLVRNLIPSELFNPQVHLVLSCLAKDSDLTDLGKRYKVTGFQDVIFTGLDESTQHGTIYNFMKRFATPLHSFGIGMRVPEDYEIATKERVLDLIFKITSNARKQGQNT